MVTGVAAPSYDPIPLNVRRPFSREDARRAGIRLRELLSPRFRRLLYDLYVDASVPITTQLLASVALEISPAGSFVSHYTAAALWGAVVPKHSEVHITVPGTLGRTRRSGIRAHAGTGRPAPTMLRGLPMSTAIQTFLDLAGLGLDLIDLVVLGDSLVKKCRVSPEQLQVATRAWSGKGAKRARRAARFVRDGVDSPMETRLRLLIVLAGLPEPMVNLIVRAPDGSWRLRFDLCYEAYRLIVEYDGRQHADDQEQWHRDIDRREELDTMGWRLIIVTHRHLRDDPLGVLSRIRTALLERGATRLHREFRTEYQRHFPTPARQRPSPRA